MYGIAHGMAYLLDPLHLGNGLPGHIRKDIEDQLCAVPAEFDIAPPFFDSNVHREKLFLQYTAFIIDAKAEQDGNTFRYQMLVQRKKTPLQWWLTDGAQWPELQQEVAIKLFSMATSSASCERNFSTMGFIHSKLRNSLSPATVEKLVFIKSNIAAFYDHKPDDEEHESSSDDNED
jgi:hAT family C-terminal dimerisation region